jgi:putative acetyltransferase
MEPSDYAEVLALWQSCEGIGLNESDGEQDVATFLARNPALSAVARDPAGRVVGAVLCGHDGRRGYLHHLAVSRAERRGGVAAALLERCFARLAAAGIQKCNIFLFQDNAEGESFWRHAGWNPRRDLLVMQKPVAPRV